MVVPKEEISKGNSKLFGDIIDEKIRNISDADKLTYKKILKNLIDEMLAKKEDNSQK